MWLLALALHPVPAPLVGRSTNIWLFRVKIPPWLE